MIIQFTVFGAQCDKCKKYYSCEGMEAEPYKCDVYQTVFDISSIILTKGWKIVDTTEGDEIAEPRIICAECLPPDLKIIITRNENE